MSSRIPKLNAQILEEAAEWFVEFDRDEPDLASRQRFDEWLRRSPEHVRAFLSLLPIWEQGARPRQLAESDLDSLIARASNAQDNVIVFKAGLVSPARDEGNRHTKGRMWYTVAACLLLGILGIGIHTARNTYSTGIGEQHSFVLDDGSVLELNARSRVRVRYSERERNVDLLAGQALFRVAHDKERPFVVHSGDARVRAIGTQFDVYRKRAGTIITVVEGRVAVVPETQGARSSPVARDSTSQSGSISGNTNRSVREAPPAHPAPMLLAAGEQAAVTANTVEPVADANVAAATAWTQRRLVFQKTSLAEVVEEFNRYNERPMRIGNPQIQAFLVSGTFSSTDPSSLIRFLREQPGMRVIETARDIRIESAP